MFYSEYSELNHDLPLAYEIRLLIQKNEAIIKKTKSRQQLFDSFQFIYFISLVPFSYRQLFYVYLFLYGYWYAFFDHAKANLYDVLNHDSKQYPTNV